MIETFYEPCEPKRERCKGLTAQEMNTRNGLLWRIKEYEEKLSVLKLALTQFPGEPTEPGHALTDNL